MTDLLYIPADHKLNQINTDLKAKLARAQSNHLEYEFKSAGDLFLRATSDLRIECPTPQPLYDAPAEAIAGLSFRQLRRYVVDVLHKAGFPEQSIPLHSENISQRIQLASAFDDPDSVVGSIRDKVAAVVATFPKQSGDIERGRNPGDVIDPYILAATQYLITNGDFEAAIEATVAHKALMIIEGLVGHLHEDVIGLMRGNVRCPEPRGGNQEALDPNTNPFPGADVVQPPWSSSRPLRFHQIKNKSGSAKGGDGKRLGDQLNKLKDYYGGEIYYHALIGNTLQGHRSRAGVERAAPSVVTLIGQASFRELTSRENGAELLLRVYQATFITVASNAGYRLDEMASSISSAFRERADQEGDGFLESILKSVTTSSPEAQDSRLFTTRKSRRSS